MLQPPGFFRWSIGKDAVEEKDCNNLMACLSNEANADGIMEMPGERELVQRIIAGDRHAFREFIEQYQRLVGHLVFRMIRNAADREELCQDVFVRAYENLAGFQFQSRISTWLGRIAYNTCINYLKKKKVPLFSALAVENPGGNGRQSPQGPDILQVPAGQKDAESALVDREQTRLLYREIEALPPLYRAVITLYHLDELRYQEISEILGLPEGTVKSHLFRARQLLKKRFTRSSPVAEKQESRKRP